MKLERNNIEFPLWRKKVDKSILEDNETPIPKFLWSLWDIESLFGVCHNKKDSNSIVTIYFKKKSFQGNIYVKKNKQCRLNISKELGNELKAEFVMSYMRSIEDRLRSNHDAYNNTKIEEEIPFWEFLDIEFDAANKTVYLTAHYVQKPMYLELFQEIVNSHILSDIENNLMGKVDLTIDKHDWKVKEKLLNQIDVKNVIYNLIDTENKEIYIGEAESLINRLKLFRKEIPNWEFYRYDSLPNDLNRSQRLAIERLLIRTFATFFKNDKGIKSMNISEYKLKNLKIDN